MMLQIVLTLAVLCYVISSSPIGPAKTPRNNGSSQINPAFNFQSLHESVQERIIQHAFDQESNLTLKQAVSFTNKMFFNVSTRHHDNIVIDLNRINETAGVSKLFCDNLKHKTSALFKNVEEKQVARFKYFHCFEDLVTLEIVGVCSDFKESQFSMMPKLKSISCTLMQNQRSLALPRWNGFIKNLPKKIESLEIKVGSKEAMNLIDQQQWDKTFNILTKERYLNEVAAYMKGINWNEELHQLADLKDFKLSLGVFNGLSLPDSALWDTIFSIEKLNCLNLFIYAKSSPFGLFQDLLVRKLRKLDLTLGSIDIIELDKVDMVSLMLNEWSATLNELQFNEVNIDLLIRHPSELHHISEIKNLNNVKLSLKFFQNREFLVFKAMRESNIPHINTLFITFINSYYTPGFLKNGLEMMFDKNKPDNIIVEVPIPVYQHAYEIIKQFKEKLAVDVDLLNKEGYNVSIQRKQFVS